MRDAETADQVVVADCRLRRRLAAESTVIAFRDGSPISKTADDECENERWKSYRTTAAWCMWRAIEWYA